MPEQDTDTQRYGVKWVERIHEAGEREDKWSKAAENAENVYSIGADDSISGDIPDFNILHSNIETMAPAIFNSTPVPDIRPKWRSEDQVLAHASNILERAIAVQIDDNALDDEIEQGMRDFLISGRGVVRVRFESEIEEYEETYETVTEDGEIEVVSETIERVTGEKVAYSVVPWRDYREGPASRFEAVPWIAFRHTVYKEDMAEYDEDLIESQVGEEIQIKGDDGNDLDKWFVWEIWDKAEREVLFVRENDGLVMKRVDDPLSLRGFYPVPRPMQPLGLSGKRTPIVPYETYRKQAEELDRVTKRIRAITSGLKVRGGIVGDAENIEAISDAGDNELVPIRNVEGLAQTGGLDKAIIWWPIDQAVRVLRELYVARDQIKQLIYEITGLSDIIRGASNASETATAQQIKTQWGSLRIRRMQSLVQRHVRDLFVLSAELIAANFTPGRLEEITGLPVDEAVIGLFDSGIHQFLIDIESDSTIRSDLTRAKGEMSEFLNGTSAFFSTMAPVVQQAPQIAGPVVDLYRSFARQFNLGKEAEDAVEKMGQIASQAAEGQQAGAQDGKQQAESEAQKMRLEAMKQQAEIELKKADLELKKADLVIKKESADAKAEIDRLDIALKQKELNMKIADLAMSSRRADREFEMEQDQRRPVKIGE